MASVIFNSFFADVAKGNIDCDTDAFKMLLVTATYSPNRDTHAKRSDITNEVAAGGGYTAGGQTVTVSVTQDNTNDRVDIGIGNPAGWTSSTITARAGVVYKSRGGANTADELVAYLDFGADVTSTNGTFSVNVTSPVRIQL
jgi:hypothetical protein